MTHVHSPRNVAPPPDGLPEVDVIDVRWLYYADYHDGPLAGMVVANLGDDPFTSAAEPLWAECYDECDEIDGDDSELHPCGFYRRYSLTRLTRKSTAAEVACHALFQAHVGTHWDVNLDGTPRHREPGAKKPRSEWHLFYDIYRDNPVRHEGVVVGWFQI
jgi:hypothetical protein